jgi:hypothetical protein
VKAYETHQRLLASWHDTFIDLVQGQLQHFFMSLLASFMQLTAVRYEGLELLHQALKATSSDAASSAFADALAAAAPAQPAVTDQAAEQVRPGLILLLAKVCVYMESTSVPYVMETIASVFSGRGGGRGSDQPPAFVAGEVARRLGTGSSESGCRATSAAVLHALFIQPMAISWLPIVIIDEASNNNAATATAPMHQHQSSCPCIICSHHPHHLTNSHTP